MSEKIDKQHRSTGQVATLRGKHHRLKERNMHRRILFLMIVASFATGLVGQRIYAQDRSDHLLIKGVTDAKVTLQQGLTAAAQQGRPISAKFEVEDGKLQLSVYTAKDGKFSEVIVDHMTGKVSETESITEGEDLAEAKSQSAAMGKAKTDLKAAVDKSAAATSGSRAVSVTPALKDGRAVASVTLLTGQEFQTVEQPLE
jgi:hypothetical protein